MKNSLTLLSALFSGIFLFSPVRSQAGEPNLIPNGEFETATGGFPQGWKGAVDDARNPPAIYVRRGTPGKDVHAGTAGIKLFVTEIGSAGETTKRNVLETIRSGKEASEPAIPLEPGTKYRLSFWVKREGFEDPKHLVVAEFAGFPLGDRGENRVSLALIKEMEGASGWERKTAEFTVPKDSEITEGSLIFRLLFPAGSAADSSTVYIDEVKLIKD